METDNRLTLQCIKSYSGSEYDSRVLSIKAIVTDKQWSEIESKLDINSKFEVVIQ